MAKKGNLYSPCSDTDIRAAVLRAAHERMKELDEKGLPSIGKMKEIMKEESDKFRSFGAYMANKGTCEAMSWAELKKAANQFIAKKAKRTK